MTTWSLGRVLLVAVAWVVAVLGYFMWRLRTLVQGSSGIGAISGGILEVLALLLGPPLILLAIWYWLRR